jgi:hypothetical protein
MATDKNFVIKNGLTVGTSEIITSAGNLTNVGSIATTGITVDSRLVLDGSKIYDNSTNGNSKGFRIGGAGLVPLNGVGTDINNVVDIGTATYKFKDLYLSGTISSGQVNATTTADATPAIIATNTGGLDSTIQRWVGDAEGMELRNYSSSGDYLFVNNAQDNGFLIFDGIGGVDILYNGAVVQSWDSLGGTDLVSGDFKVGGTTVIQSSGNNLVNIGVVTATALISTDSHVQSGDGSGGVALTINDGYGNANITWNHLSGVPEQNGNSARIEVNTDSTSNATMYFELKSGVTSGTAVQTDSIMELNDNGLFMYTGKYIYGAGGVTINADDNDFVVEDNTDAVTNFIWRDHSGSKLYLGTDTAVVTLRSALDLNSNNITNAGTISSGAITADGLTTSADINFGDNDKAVFGAGSDLQIYHDGTNSFIKDTAANLVLNTNSLLVSNAANTENIIVAQGDGAVTLYHNNLAKIATTSTGIDVTGTATMDGLTVSASAATANITSTSGGATLNLTHPTATDGYSIRQGNANADDFRIFEGSKIKLNITTGGDISFYEDTGTTAKFFWDASAESLGIGTTSPASAATLHLRDTTPHLYIQSDDGQSGKLLFGDATDNSRGGLEYTSSDSLIFLTNNLATALTLNSSGNATFSGTISSGAITSSGASTFSSTVNIDGELRLDARYDGGNGDNVLAFKDSGGDYTIRHNVNDGNGNYSISIGYSGAGNGEYAVTGDGVGKILFGGHGRDGAISLNSAPTGTAGNDISFSIGLLVDGSDNTIRVGASANGTGMDTGAGTKVFDASANAFATSYSVGSTTVIDSSRNLTNIGTADFSSTIGVNGSGTYAILDNGSVGWSYSPQESGVASVRYFLLFNYDNNASYPYLTNRTPSGRVSIYAGTAAGSGENEKIRVNGGDGTTEIDMFGTLDMNTNNITGVGTISSGAITLADGSHLQTYNTNGTTGTGGVDLPRGGHITFYGNNSTNHSIGSRSSSGAITDDLRISSYGALYIDLDSNSNNDAGADFVIGRHGGGTGTMSTLVTISGEDGSYTSSGTISSGAITSSGTLIVGAGTQSVAGDADITVREGNAFAGIDLRSTRTSGNIGGIRSYNSSNVGVGELLFEVQGRLNYTGSLGFALGGTSFIDGSRNLTNIGTISSGAITTSGTISTGSGTEGALALTDLYSPSTGDHLSSIGWLRSSGGVYLGYGAKQSGSATWVSTYDNFSGKRNYVAFDEDSVTMVFAPAQQTTVGSAVTGLTERFKFDLNNGIFSVNGSTVIDSSRNLTNIGTISSGTITSTGLTVATASGAVINLQDTGSHNWQLATDNQDNFFKVKDGASTTYFKVGTADSEFATNLNLTSGHVYQVNGTTVIDASRNLTNIAKITGNSSSGGVTTFNVGRGDVYFENNSNSNANGAGITLRTSSNPTANTDGCIFDVRSSGQAARLWVGQDLTSAGYNNFYVGNLATGGEGTPASYEIELNATSGNITAQGNITAYGTVSDIRQKENIVQIDKPIERLEKIKGITFNYKKKSEDERLMGVIAQDLLEDDILKLAVYEQEDFKADDDDPLKNTYGVRYEHLTAILIEAVKEQQKANR